MTALTITTVTDPDPGLIRARGLGGTVRGHTARLACPPGLRG
jgi:hypothetical protein